MWWYIIVPLPCKVRIISVRVQRQSLEVVRQVSRRCEIVYIDETIWWKNFGIISQPTGWEQKDDDEQMMMVMSLV